MTSPFHVDLLAAREARNGEATALRKAFEAFRAHVEPDVPAFLKHRGPDAGICPSCSGIARWNEGKPTCEDGCDADGASLLLRWAAEEAAQTAPQHGRRVVLTPASAITPERLRWLWRERLPLRGLSLIAGEAGLGKSTLTVQLAADVTRGGLDGELHGEPADVLIATAEDHWQSVVWGRLTAAGADMDRVHRLTVESDGEEELLTLPDDVAELERRCEELAERGRRVALVVVDPVGAFIGGKVDTHREAAVRRVLAPLASLAERQQLTVLGVAHLNKDEAGRLLSRVGGSVAFGAAPRSVLAFARHPDDPDKERGLERVIVHAKSNQGRHAPSLAAHIESQIIAEVGDVSRLVIDGECEVGPDDLGARGGEERSAADEAAEWLADELADGEWREAREVKVRAGAAGHKPRTLQRARKSLGVEDRRRGVATAGGGQSEWRLPLVPPIGPSDGTSADGTSAGTRKVEPNPGNPPAARASSGERGTSGGSEPVEPPGDDLCQCTRPARSPRANGPGFCQTCKRPMADVEATS